MVKDLESCETQSDVDCLVTQVLEDCGQTAYSHSETYLETADRLDKTDNGLIGLSDFMRAANKKWFELEEIEENKNG